MIFLAMISVAGSARSTRRNVRKVSSNAAVRTRISSGPNTCFSSKRRIGIATAPDLFAAFAGREPAAFPIIASQPRPMTRASLVRAHLAVGTLADIGPHCPNSDTLSCKLSTVGSDDPTFRLDLSPAQAGLFVRGCSAKSIDSTLRPRSGRAQGLDGRARAATLERRRHRD